MPYTGKKFLVVGAARTGIAIANLLLNHVANVSVCDNRKREKLIPFLKDLRPEIRRYFGNHSTCLLKGMDFVVKSPGVPPDIPLLKEARKKAIEIVSEIEVAYNLSPSVPIVGITGTNGKSTTTELVGKILDRIKGKQVVVAGNIGIPFSSVVDRISKNTILVLEISSYQLEDINKFRPKIGVTLNITPDHLERYDGLKDYVNAKARLFSNQTRKDYLILNYDDLRCRNLAKRARSNVQFFSIKGRVKKGIFFENGKIFYSSGKKGLIPIHISREDIGIPGPHNLENALVGILIGKLFGMSDKRVREAIRSFKGLPHRLEIVSKIKGRLFVNDSKATNVSSVERSLETFPLPIILIMGGRDKGSPYRPLSKLVKNKVKKLIVIGEAGAKISKELKDHTSVIMKDTIRDAVDAAYKASQAGDTILLSPGCSSFDQYDNFEERGDDFKKWARRLRTRK